MTTRLRRGEKEFLIEDGVYNDYDQLKEILQGHPRGIDFLNVSPFGLIISIVNFAEGEVTIKQTAGEVSDVVTKIHTSQHETKIQTTIFNQANVEITSQKETLLFKQTTA